MVTSSPGPASNPAELPGTTTPVWGGQYVEWVQRIVETVDGNTSVLTGEDLRSSIRKTVNDSNDGSLPFKAATTRLEDLLAGKFPYMWQSTKRLLQGNNPYNKRGIGRSQYAQVRKR